MKIFTANILIVFLTSILLSCTEDQIQCTRVSGSIETEILSVSGFKRIFFKDVGNLHITQGEEFQFQAEGQQVVLDAMEVSIENEELIINLNKCFNGDDYKLDIYITLPEIEEIEMAGVGNLTTNNLESESLSLILSGITEIFDVNVAVDSLSTFLTGDGNISLSGECRSHLMVLSGIGELEAYGLSSEKSYIKMNGLGNCYVNSEIITAEINSAGKIYYIGDPQIVITGSGEGQVIDAD